jgi:hypothetical protein
MQTKGVEQEKKHAHYVTGLPESIPRKNESDEAENNTPRYDENHKYLLRRLSPYLPLWLKNRQQSIEHQR